MDRFVGYIVKNLVEHPDAVEVRCFEGEKEILVELRVADEDMGKVVGSKGKTINALRTIVMMVAARLGRRVRLELME